MRFPKLLRLAALAAAVVLAAGCARKAEQTEQKAGGAPLHVGLVFDVGGRGDKSFNDAAYLGLMRARDELGADTEGASLK